MADIEPSREFAIALSGVLGLELKGLMSFSIDVGGDQDSSALAIVTAKYAVPRGRGEAAATLIRKFGLVPGPEVTQTGADLDMSTSLEEGFERVHRVTGS